MQALLINGVSAESLGLTVAEAPGWMDMPARDVATAQILGRPGLKALTDPSEGARRISLTGTVIAATAALLRPKVDALKMALLASPLTLVFGDNATRQVTAVLTAFTTKSVPQGAFVQEGLNVEAVLSALDPFAYDLAQTVVAFGDRMPLGTGIVRPVITITGASTNHATTLFNRSNVAIASLSLSLVTLVGDTLIIDMDKKTVKKNGVSVIGSIVAGDFFEIDPTDQANFGGVGPFLATSSGDGPISYYRSWR